MTHGAHDSDPITRYTESKQRLEELLAAFARAPELLLVEENKRLLLEALDAMAHASSISRTPAPPAPPAPEGDGDEETAGAPGHGAPEGDDEEREPEVATYGARERGFTALCYRLPEVLERLEGNLDRRMALDSIQRLEDAIRVARRDDFGLLAPDIQEHFYAYVVAQCRALQDEASAADRSMLMRRVKDLFEQIKDLTPTIFIHGMKRDHSSRHGASFRGDADHHAAALERSFHAPEAAAPSAHAGRVVAPERSADPTLAELLEDLAARYPDDLVVLDSAYASARDAGDFRQAQRAGEMMERLITDYLPRIEGGGDATAKEVFTLNEYSATESETTRENSRAMRLRTFDYRGEEVVFLRHLRIGTGESSRDGWRCHFHHDSQRQKIVIGHCGAHLDLR